MTGVVPEEALRICRDARARARRTAWPTQTRRLARSETRATQSEEAAAVHLSEHASQTAANPPIAASQVLVTSRPRRRRIRRTIIDEDNDLTFDEIEGTVSIGRLSRTSENGASRNVRRRVAEARVYPDREVVIEDFGPRSNSALQPLINFLGRMPVSGGGLSQYFLSELFRRARESGDHMQANPPASSHVIANLAPVSSSVILSGDTCAICQDELCNSKFGQARQMPCRHAFHHSCVTPWLQQHNTCPVCRAEVESVCPKYNRQNQDALCGLVREEAMAPPEAVVEGRNQGSRPNDQEVVRLLRAVSAAQNGRGRHGTSAASTLSSLHFMQATPRAFAARDFAVPATVDAISGRYRQQAAAATAPPQAAAASHIAESVPTQPSASDVSTDDKVTPAAASPPASLEPNALGDGVASGPVSLPPDSMELELAITPNEVEHGSIGMVEAGEVLPVLASSDHGKQCEPLAVEHRAQTS